MPPERGRHPTLDELFHSVREAQGAERAARLAEIEAEDAALHRELTELLEADAQSSGWLEEPALGRGFDVGRPESHSDHAASAEPASLPERIGRFTVQRRVGVGATSVVYRAVEDGSGRPVALKLVRPGLARGRALRRLELEVETLGRLEHSGIARLYGSGEVDLGAGRQPYFAMEWVEGRPITTAAADAPAREKLTLLAELGDAIHHAHQRGIVHRDLKPDHVLVDGDGRVRVLDFGVARLVDEADATRLTVEGQLVGTVAYMSPEQLQGDDGVDVRSDVFALGVIAYELLGGRHPFVEPGVPLPEVARRIHETTPARLGALDSKLRGDVELIVGKALAQEPARRYASASEWVADLRRHLAHQPVGARAPSPLYLLGRFVRRRPWLAATWLAGLVLLGLLVWGMGELKMLRGMRIQQTQNERDLAAAFHFGTRAAMDATAGDLAWAEAFEPAFTAVIAHDDSIRGVIQRNFSREYGRYGDVHAAVRLAEDSLWSTYAGPKVPSSRNYHRDLGFLAMMYAQAGRLPEAEGIVAELLPDGLPGATAALAPEATLLERRTAFGILLAAMWVAHRAEDPARAEGARWLALELLGTLDVVTDATAIHDLLACARLDDPELDWDEVFETYLDPPRSRGAPTRPRRQR